MNDPESYVKSNAMPRFEAKNMISSYIGHIKWKHSENETVLDVGCGPCDVTWDIIRSHIPSEVRIVGADINQEMLLYAAEKYPEIRTLLIDIKTNDLPTHLHNAFDHIFSFLCLHWIHEQRQVMVNIYQLLKSGGDILLYYMASHPYFDAIYKASQKEKWRYYIDNAHEYMPIFQNKDPNFIQQSLRDILVETGFTVSVCQVVDSKYKYSNLNELKDLLTAVNPHYLKIPDHSRKEYLDDMLKELVNLEILREDDFVGSHEIEIHYSLIVISASKIVTNS